MNRVLIVADPTQMRRLSSWLSGWGLVAAPLTAAGGHPAAQTRERAAAVIVAWSEETSWINGAAVTLPEHALVPLVLIDAPGAPVALRRVAAAVLADGEDMEARLREALAYCVDVEASPASALPMSGDLRQHLHFFNHELRTPLAAASAALQTLARRCELAPVNGELDLLDIALRNLKRLEHTVEWAGDFIDATMVDNDAAPAIATTGELVQDIDELVSAVVVEWSAEMGDWGKNVAIAREQWRRLLRQTLHAIHYFQSDLTVAVAASEIAAADSELTRLALDLRLEGVAESSHRVNRTGLSDPVDDADELQRLIGFMVAPGLLDVLGGRIDVEAGSPWPVVRLTVPLVPLRGGAACLT